MKKKIPHLLATALAMTMLASCAIIFAPINNSAHSYAANPGLSTPLGLGGDSFGDIALGSTNAGDKAFGMNKAEPTEGLVPLHIAKVTTENPAPPAREATCNDCHAVTALAARIYADPAYAQSQSFTDNSITLGGELFRTENVQVSIQAKSMLYIAEAFPNSIVIAHNDGQHEHPGAMMMHTCIGGQNIPGGDMV